MRLLQPLARPIRYIRWVLDQGTAASGIPPSTSPLRTRVAVKVPADVDTRLPPHLSLAHLSIQVLVEENGAIQTLVFNRPRLQDS